MGSFFQLLNPNYLYEQLRIPYFYNNAWHTYIVDFIDNNKKEVIEIKPKKESLKPKNLIKEKSLIDWCKINNYIYKKIDEDYFKNIEYNYDIIKDQPDFIKLSNPKFKKYFKNYEN